MGYNSFLIYAILIVNGGDYMFYHGFDTDDLTDRQNYVFNKLRRKSLVALGFIEYCIWMNKSSGQFNNYDGDCDYLNKVKPEVLKECGIDLNKL